MSVSFVLKRIFAAEKFNPATEQDREVFTGYDCTANALRKWGDWCVNRYGDVINTKHSYPIYSNQVGGNVFGWIAHLRDKKWFDAKSERDFLTAFSYSLWIAKTTDGIYEEENRAVDETGSWMP